ncbi:thiol reductant ABC exporter subunit CydC [Glaciihabitans sp. UYNi722]|uniref:thiol reductant ABC exporter subunit CydC n=1 Tax=Glaciihabitans sp. UYNi722 TaxID=3156344 RepID=UPI003398252B
MSTSPVAGISVMERPTLYLLGLLSGLKAVAIIGLATALSTGIVTVIDGHGDLLPIVGIGVGSGMLRSLVTWGHRVVATRALLGSKERLRAELAERVVENGVQPGSVATLATQGLDELDKYFTVFLPALVTAGTVPLLVGARILFADWVSALIIVLTVPLIPVFMALIGLHTQERVAEATTALNRLSDHLVELARGLPVLVGLGRATEQVTALRKISESHRMKTIQTLRTAFLSALALELIATISVAVVAVFIGVRLVAGDLSLEVGLLVLILAPECMTPFREIGTAFHASQNGKEAIARTRAILDAARPASIVEAGIGPVTVVGLSVRYTDRSANSLSCLGFQALPGEITVLDGRSGTGKSTVFRVLAGRLVTGEGVTVDGRVSGIESGRMAWLPQHPHTVADTVLDELLLYGADNSAADNSAAADSAALALDVLERLGLAHLADVSPSLVSPGELRRLAFGRVLMRVADGANVVLLDEPTSQLDRGSARAVIDEMVAMKPWVAVIVASHDPAVRALADRRVILSKVRTESPISVAHPSAMPSRARRSPANVGGSRPLRELAVFLRPVAGRLIGTIVLGTLAALFALALIALSGWLIVRASEHPPIMYLLVAIVGVRFFGIGRAVLRYSERLLGHSAVFRALTELRMRLWSSLATKGFARRDLLTGGSTLDRLVRDVDQVRDLAIRVVLPLSVGVTTLVVTIAALGSLAPAALPLLVILGVAAGVVAPLAALWADRRASRGQQFLKSTVLRRFAAMLGAADELRANGVDGRIRRELGDLDRAAGVSAKRSASALGLGGAIVVAVCALSAILMLPLLASAGNIAPGLVAVLALVPLGLIDPLMDFVGAVQLAPALREVLTRVSRTTAVDGTEPRPAFPEQSIERLGLEGLAARWTPSGEPVFEAVNAVVQRGEWLIVTGPSGSGKSTMLALLLGRLDPMAGHYLVNGQDTAGLDLSSSARRFGWCPQEGHLFDSTMRANLLLARSRAEAPDDAEMTAVLEQVGLGALLDRLPAGLDTLVGAEAGHLSGGERQRVAVARTLLTGADVILIDEPTAHLDEESAASLMTDLRIALADRITVLVTHSQHGLRPDDIRIDLGGAWQVMPMAQSGLVVSGAA